MKASRVLCLGAALLGANLKAPAQSDLGTFDFGDVPVGTTKTVTGFAWSGGASNGTNLVMVSEQFIGPDAADFRVSTNYTGTTMPYGQTFPFSMSFTPSHAGAETSTLSIYETPDPPFGAVIWHLTGTGRTPIAVTGPVVPELAPLTQAMTNYMTSHGFEAGTLALMKDTRLVLRQGFGWRDSALTIPTHPDNLFRLASVSKTITESAVIKLVNASKLNLSTKIYSYLGIPPWGGVLGDNRITNITVQNLVDHSAGWDRDVSPVGDPVFSTVQISTQMGLSHPAAPTNVISWMFSKPLDFAPGATNAYSNFGYQVLARVIEKAAGKSYIDYVQQDLLGPFGNTNLIGFTNVVQSRSRPRDLDPWEIWYADSPSLVRSAVDYPTNLFVRWVDGGGYFESFDAFGGLSASAIGLCNYLRNYWEGGDRRFPGEYYGWGYIFYGSLPGATSVLYQNVTQNPTTTNGLEFAALFNERTGVGDDNGEAEAAIYSASTNITSWPTNGGGMIQWGAPLVNVDKTAGSVTVPLVRSGLSTLPVKVSYTTYARTAGPANYAATSGIVSFAGGDTNKNVIVPILNDGGSGAPKEFLLELISASGGAWLGDRFTCLVHVIEQNAPAKFINQSMTNGNFRAQISGATGLVLNVQLSTNLVIWQPLQTFSNSPGLVTITDTNTPIRPRSFYRVLVQ